MAANAGGDSDGPAVQRIFRGGPQRPGFPSKFSGFWVRRGFELGISPERLLKERSTVAPAGISTANSAGMSPESLLYDKFRSWSLASKRKFLGMEPLKRLELRSRSSPFGNPLAGSSPAR